MKLSDNTSVSMPMRNLLAICAAIAIGTMSFFTLQERITKLETRATLFETDLLKKAEQTPINQELYMLSEWLSKNQEGIQKEMESMMNNRVNIDFLKSQVTKLQKDVEDLKDKVRNNGSN